MVKGTKRTDAEFKREIFELVGDEHIFLSQYEGIKKPIPVRHKTCGKTYSVTPSNFLYRNSRCPHCSNRRSPSNEEFQQKVAELVGGDYTILTNYQSALKKVRLRHEVCGHEYEVRPRDFFDGNRCPNCVYSRGEKLVADTLDAFDIRYSREHTFDQLERKRFDFYLPDYNIAIEYDGEQHYKAIEAWGGESYLEEVRQSDAIKTAFCADHGIPLLRIPCWEFDNVEQIVKDFVESVKQPQPTA